MPLTRRRLLGAACALPLPHIARAARRTVTFAAPGDEFQDSYTAAVLEPFRRAHPDIELTRYPAATSEQILSLLHIHPPAPAIDVALLEQTVAHAATVAELVTPLTRDSLPVLAELPDTAFVAGVAGPAVMLDSLAIAYAPSRVHPAPASWLALWEKDLRGQLVVEPAPASSGVAFTLIADVLFGKGNYRESVTSGINAIATLAPGIANWDPIPDVPEAIVAGKASIGVTWNARGQTRARAAPEKLAMALPNEGSVFQVTTINLAASVRDAEAARSFIEYALGAEAQAAVAEKLFYTPVNLHAALGPEALARTAATPARRERMMDVDWLAVAAMRDRIARDWRSRIINRHG